MKKKQLLVWLSWGVDSAVAAALLLEQGYEVVGGFMKNYVSDTGNCTTYKDAEEAINVANHLGIKLLSFDLQQEYQEKIIDYIFDGYQRGITPNPDVLCNSLIKFDVFLQKALELGFDAIATGHYARVMEKDGNYQLFRWVDHHKDQSYFLAGLNQFQLSKSFFPLWTFCKAEVRATAKKIWLPNADRKDSQGLCFIGNVPIRTFLLQRFPEKVGAILLRQPDGKFVQVGTHSGAYFYTIGQKHGLGLNFKAYVYRIDVKNNLLYVTDKENEALKSKCLVAQDWHWIVRENWCGVDSLNGLDSSLHDVQGGLSSDCVGLPQSDGDGGETLPITGKIRYRQNPPVPCKLREGENGEMHVVFEEEQRAVASGQIFVAYQGEQCLGCGTIM